MDLKKLVGQAIQVASKVVGDHRPENRQEEAVADLAARKIKLEAKELQNLFFSAGGGYGQKITGEDIQRLKNARAAFGYLKNRPPIHVVGYLVPTRSGGVEIQFKGKGVDRLLDPSAKLLREKTLERVPVKIEVSIIANRDPRYDRPHLKLKRDTNPLA